MPRNTNSRRVMEKLAIREEGVALRFLEINGAWEDHVRFGITVEEWQQRTTRADERGLDRRVTLDGRRWRSGATRPARRNACAFARRSAVRRFHIFIFQWRWRAFAGACAWLARHRDGAAAPMPGRARGTSSGSYPALTCAGDGLQLAVDPMPLVVGVCSQVHLGRRGRLVAAMTLAHLVPPLVLFGTYGRVSFP